MILYVKIKYGMWYTFYSVFLRTYGQYVLSVSSFKPLFEYIIKFLIHGQKENQMLLRRIFELHISVIFSLFNRLYALWEPVFKIAFGFYVSLLIILYIFELVFIKLGETAKI
jgi:hypothetical protein